MAYRRTVWVNDSPPYVNAQNLNNIEDGIDVAHDIGEAAQAHSEQEQEDRIAAVTQEAQARAAADTQEAQARTAHTNRTDNPHGVTAAQAGAVPTTQRGTANGVATLDATTKIPVSQIPDTVVGGMDYQGTWNASTNTPAITTIAKSKGDYWKVATAGATNLSGTTDWKVGDWAAWNGAAFDKIDNTDQVVSVEGRQGAVVLSDIYPKGATGTPTDGQVWTYDQASGGWLPKTPASSGGGGETPPGVMLEYGGASAPSGYLLCDGAAVSRTTFSALFAILGTTFGAGNGSTTFNLPDRRGRVGVGVGSGTGLTTRTRGEVFGAESTTLSVEQMPPHVHRMSAGGASNAPTNGSAGRLAALINGYNSSAYSTGWTEQVGGGEAHSNVQPSIAINYIIKT